MPGRLTHAQKGEYQRYRQLLQFFKQNAVVVDAFAPLSREVADMNSLLSTLDSYISTAKETSKDEASARTALLDEIAKIGGNICLRARAFALKTNNTELAEAARFTSEKIRLLEDIEVQPAAAQIHEAVRAIMGNPAFAPYGVTPGMLSSLVANANAFGEMLDNAGEAQAGHMVTDAGIEDVLTQLRACGEQFDLLVATYLDSQPEFYHAYIASSGQALPT